MSSRPGLDMPKTDTTPRRRKKPLWRRILKGLLIAPLALAPVAGIGFLGWREARFRIFARVAATLPQELEAARKEGVPIEPADLRRNPPVPEYDNAATLYRQSFELWKSRPEAERNADSTAIAAIVKAEYTPQEEVLAQEALKRNKTILSLAEEASLKEVCDFERQWELGPNLLLPEYASMREFARCFAARATISSRHGDPISALNDIAAGARMGRHAGQDRMLISMLVRIAIHAIMDRAFYRVATQYRDRPDVLELAEKTCDAFGDTAHFEEFLGAEVVSGRVTVDLLKHRSEDFYDTLNPFVSMVLMLNSNRQSKLDTLCDAWEARMINYWRRYLSTYRAAGPDLLDQFQKSTAMAEREGEHEGEPTYELWQILCPAFNQATVKTMHDEASRRMRRVALRLLQFRLRHHSYPASLSELNGPVTEDPFTNSLLLYRKTPTGCMLYSVGEDFKDDGGAGKKTADTKPLDIVVELPN